jgi:hypothetical protein
LIGLLLTYAVAKDKLFPKHPVDPGAARRTPRERFNEVATTIFSTPKTTVDEREAKWKAEKKRRRRTPSD